MTKLSRLYPRKSTDFLQGIDPDKRPFLTEQRVLETQKQTVDILKKLSRLTKVSRLYFFIISLLKIKILTTECWDGNPKMRQSIYTKSQSTVSNTVDCLLLVYRLCLSRKIEQSQDGQGQSIWAKIQSTEFNQLTVFQAHIGCSDKE